MTRVPAAATELRRHILAARNGDGAWGYYPGKSSRIEPTCWAGLCFSGTSTTEHPYGSEAWSWLGARQHASGFISDTFAEPPNLGFNALGALAIRQASTWRPEPFQRLISTLGRAKGAAIEPTKDRQDNTLQGWSWIEGTFSWVEPTSWGLLALKKAPALLPQMDRAARIDEAERLLLDRVCRTGGWNYGNSNVLGQELAAYVPTTAVALLALQDRRDEPNVQKSLNHLVVHQLAEPAGMALALTSICLRVYGLSTEAVDEQLARLAERHGFFNNLHIQAMALYSLTGHDHDVEAFRV